MNIGPLVFLCLVVVFRSEISLSRASFVKNVSFGAWMLRNEFPLCFFCVHLALVFLSDLSGRVEKSSRFAQTNVDYGTLIGPKSRLRTVLVDHFKGVEHHFRTARNTDVLNLFLCGLETVTRPFSETDADMKPTVMPKEVMVERRHFSSDPPKLKSAGGVRLFRPVELPDLCRR